jgi:Tfp pilus assembly protein PilV
MLKIVEVVVLIVAGLCFVAWQFRDLRRSRELTRKQREAEQSQALHAASEAQKSSEKRDADGG